MHFIKTFVPLLLAFVFTSILNNWILLTPPPGLTAFITALVPNILVVVTEHETKEIVASSSGYATNVLSALNTLRNYSGLLFTTLIAIADTADAATITEYSPEVCAALITAIAGY